MKILQVTNFFKPSWEAGGPVRSVYEISKCLNQAGHEVTVFATDGFKFRLNVIKNKPVDVDGIKTYYFRNLSSFLTKKMNFPIPYYMPYIAKKEFKKFDVIHLNEYRTFLAIATRYYAKKYKIPYVLQPRGTLPTTSKSKQKRLFDLLFGNNIVKDASILMASSKIESNQYQEVVPSLKPEKIVHVPNGINLKDYEHLPEKGQFKNEYSIDQDEKFILFLSRLHERKGADVLIEAFSDLKKEIKNVKLIIAGPDEGHLNYLKSLVNNLNIENDVIFPGALYENEKLKAYVDADVFVLPSKDRYESFGNVVLEALACGTPAIVTNNCGVSEWIEKKDCYVVDPTVDTIYYALFDVLNNDENHLELEKSAKMIVEKYSIESIVDSYLNCYSELLLAK